MLTYSSDISDSTCRPPDFVLGEKNKYPTLQRKTNLTGSHIYQGKSLSEGEVKVLTGHQRGRGLLAGVRMIKSGSLTSGGHGRALNIHSWERLTPNTRFQKPGS